MAVVFPNGAEGDILELRTNKRSVENLTLKLFVSNTTPANTDTAGTYTEMSTQGYASKALVAGDWTVTPGSPSLAAAALQTWTFDGTGGLTQVYGWYLVGASSSRLAAVERFTDGPYPIANNGDKINVTAKMTGASTTSD